MKPESQNKEIKMPETTKPRFQLQRTAVSLLLSGLMIFVLSECKSSTSSSTGEADIAVTNEYGEALNIYMDGVYQFLLEYKDTKEIDNVSLATHKLEARKVGTDAVVDSKEIDVEDKQDYTWTINGPPRIQVTNNYGETLSIYMDYTYQFDLRDKEDRWIYDVTFADHFLQAIRPSTGKEVASKTITVNEDTTYSWSVN